MTLSLLLPLLLAPLLIRDSGFNVYFGVNKGTTPAPKKDADKKGGGKGDDKGGKGGDEGRFRRYITEQSPIINGLPFEVALGNDSFAFDVFNSSDFNPVSNFTAVSGAVSMNDGNNSYPVTTTKSKDETSIFLDFMPEGGIKESKIEPGGMTSGDQVDTKTFGMENQSKGAVPIENSTVIGSLGNTTLNAVELSRNEEIRTPQDFDASSGTIITKGDPSTFVPSGINALNITQIRLVDQTAANELPSNQVSTVFDFFTSSSDDSNGTVNALETSDNLKFITSDLIATLFKGEGKLMLENNSTSFEINSYNESQTQTDISETVSTDIEANQTSTLLPNEGPPSSTEFNQSSNTGSIPLGNTEINQPSTRFSLAGNTETIQSFNPEFNQSSNTGSSFSGSSKSRDNEYSKSGINESIQSNINQSILSTEIISETDSSQPKAEFSQSTKDETSESTKVESSQSTEAELSQSTETGSSHSTEAGSSPSGAPSNAQSIQSGGTESSKINKLVTLLRKRRHVAINNEATSPALDNQQQNSKTRQKLLRHPEGNIPSSSGGDSPAYDIGDRQSIDNVMRVVSLEKESSNPDETGQKVATIYDSIQKLKEMRFNQRDFYYDMAKSLLDAEIQKCTLESMFPTDFEEDTRILLRKMVIIIQNCKDQRKSSGSKNKRETEREGIPLSLFNRNTGSAKRTSRQNDEVSPNIDIGQLFLALFRSVFLRTRSDRWQTLQNLLGGSILPIRGRRSADESGDWGKSIPSRQQAMDMYPGLSDIYDSLPDALVKSEIKNNSLVVNNVTDKDAPDLPGDSTDGLNISSESNLTNQNNSLETDFVSNTDTFKSTSILAETSDVSTTSFIPNLTRDILSSQSENFLTNESVDKLATTSTIKQNNSIVTDDSATNFASVKSSANISDISSDLPVAVTNKASNSPGNTKATLVSALLNSATVDNKFSPVNFYVSDDNKIVNSRQDTFSLYTAKSDEITLENRVSQTDTVTEIAVQTLQFQTSDSQDKKISSLSTSGATDGDNFNAGGRPLNPKIQNVQDFITRKPQVSTEVKSDFTYNPDSAQPVDQATINPDSVQPVVQDTNNPDSVQPVGQDTNNPDSVQPVDQDTYNPDSVQPVVQDTYNPDSVQPVDQDTYNPDSIQPVVQATINPDSVPPVVQATYNADSDNQAQI